MIDKERGDRAACRKAMRTDPEWQDHLGRADSRIERQNTRILGPTDFWCIQ